MKYLIYVFVLYTTIFCQERISLIIGANRGLSSERQLRFAVSDAKRVKNVLQELGRFQESRCYQLLNPTIHSIEKTVDELNGRIKEIQESGRQVEFLLYYSGHGSNSALHIDGQVLSHSTLLSMIDTMNADLTIAIVDACYSGALVAEKGVSIAPPLSLKLTDTLSAKGSILLTSSSPDQTSHESADLGSSVFTHHIISALRGAADYNRSGTVSLGEAYSYAHMHTSLLTGNQTGVLQQPSYAWNIKGSEEIYLTWLQQGSAVLHLSGGLSCPHFIISEPTQSIVAEFTPRQQPLTIALPIGVYRIQRVCKNDIAYTEVDMTWKNACTLSLASLKATPPTPITRKGPLDRPSLNHSIIAGVHILPVYPSVKTYMIAPVLSYAIYSMSFKTMLTVGYGRSQLSGTSLTIKRSMIHYGASFGTIIYASRKFTLYGGIESGLHFDNQELFRREETRLQEVGYKPLPAEKTIVPFGGISVTATPFLFNRIPLHCTVGLNDYVARLTSGYKQFPRLLFGVSTGITIR